METNTKELQAVANTTQTIEKKVYTGVAARILKLLAAGVFPNQVANATGVTEGYISQLKAEPQFQNQLEGLIQKNVEEAIEVDNDYRAIEKAAQLRLKASVGFLTNVDQIVRVLKFTNEVKLKTQPVAPINAGAGSESAGRPVILVLPTIIKETFVVNPNNEVVATQDRELVTMNSASMSQLLKQSKEAETVEVQSKPEILPNVQRKPSASEDKWSNL